MSDSTRPAAELPRVEVGVSPVDGRWNVINPDHLAAFVRAIIAQERAEPPRDGGSTADGATADRHRAPQHASAGKEMAVAEQAVIRAANRVAAELERENARLRRQVEAAEAEITAWRECARYDPTMEGPRFKGWDRSALDRCRRTYIEAAAKKGAR